MNLSSITFIELDCPSCKIDVDIHTEEITDSKNIVTPCCQTLLTKEDLMEANCYVMEGENVIYVANIFKGE